MIEYADIIKRGLVRRSNWPVGSLLLPRKLELLAIHPTPPTITLSVANGVTAIANPIKIAPRPKAATYYDTVNDEHYEVVGGLSDKVLIDAADTARGDYLTGGAASAARWIPHFRAAVVNTQYVDISVRSTAAAPSYHLTIDGQRVSANATVLSTANPGRYLIQLDFGSVGSRVIEFEGIDLNFNGMTVPATAQIMRPAKTKPILCMIGDSISGGASGVGRLDTWSSKTALRLGMDHVNCSIGGSGYLTATAAFSTRVGDVVASNPDMLMVFGSQNDSQTSAEIATAADALLTAVWAQLPRLPIVLFGAWITTDGYSASRVGNESALRAVAANRGIPFVSWRDPHNLLATAPAWGIANYKLGDVVTRDGLPWTCKLAHNETGGVAFVRTYWQCSALITGSGRVGSTNGFGTADVYILADAIHASQSFHDDASLYVANMLLKHAARPPLR